MGSRAGPGEDSGRERCTPAMPGISARCCRVPPSLASLLAAARSPVPAASPAPAAPLPTPVHVASPGAVSSAAGSAGSAPCAFPNCSCSRRSARSPCAGHLAALSLLHTSICHPFPTSSLSCSLAGVEHCGLWSLVWAGSLCPVRAGGAGLVQLTCKVPSQGAAPEHPSQRPCLRSVLPVLPRYHQTLVLRTKAPSPLGPRAGCRLEVGRAQGVPALEEVTAAGTWGHEGWERKTKRRRRADVGRRRRALSPAV